MHKIIFLHGLSLSRTIWNRLTPNITNYECITPDLIGHGDNNKERIFDFKTMWSDVLPSFSDYSENILVLHSMASALLPEIALSGLKIKKIVLIEANLIEQDSKWSKDLSSMNSKDFNRTVQRIKDNPVMFLKMQLSNDLPHVELKKLSEGYLKFNSIALKEIAKNLFIRTTNGEIQKAISNLSSQIIYLRGGNSPDWNEGRRFLKNKEIQYIEIPNSKHYPMIDNPHDSLRAILN